MPMVVEAMELPDVKLVRLTPFPDSRGLFVETFEMSLFDELGLPTRFVQDALSISSKRHTFRGLHFQRPPHAQTTLVRVSRGRLLDVAVDLRASSSTYGRHVSVEMTADDWVALYLPTGFAHGFCTLEDNTEVSYKLSGPYSAEHATGIDLSDPELGITWPVSPAEGILSDKDRALPRLRDLPVIFP